MERTDYVNIDVELSLASGSYLPHHEINAEWEFIYFFINKDATALKNQIEYDSSYLEYLKRLELDLPRLSPLAKNFNYWVGDLGERERFLNSKFSLPEIREDHGIYPTGKVVHNEKELKLCFEKLDVNNFILKRELSLSGIGHLVIDKDWSKKKIKFPLLAEPYFARVLDVSFTRRNGKITPVLNFIGKKNDFLGAQVWSDEEPWRDIFNRLGLSYDTVIAKMESIFSKLESRYEAGGLLHIDTFVYKSDEGNKFWPICEVNYRRTLADLPLSLTSQGTGLFSLVKRKSLPAFSSWAEVLEFLGSSLFNIHNKIGILPLSPITSHHHFQFFSFYVAARDTQEIRQILFESPLKNLSNALIIQ